MPPVIIPPIQNDPGFAVVPDAHGRNIGYANDPVNQLDIYTVPSGVDGVPATILSFPEGTASNIVYLAINGQAPAGSGGTSALTPPTNQNNNAGKTSDRPGNPDYATMYFDNDLGKPIWFVGWGTTGWVDAMGNSV